jgi:site-specific DNA recombinase
MRILGATRLSHSTDESTSVERQREQIEAIVKARGDDVVAITEDVDVSGAVSPFKRADLGPWLTEPKKIAAWDCLMIAKLDRLSRSLLDFATLLEWCTANGKIIVSIGESFDLGTSAGRMMANLLATFAQFERETMSERRGAAAVKLRSNGHWGGGAVPYGYRTIKVNSHHELELDPAQQGIVVEIAADVIAGRSLNSIANALNANGTATAQGGRWYASTIGIMMRNPALKGYVMHDGQPVRGDDGMPVRRDAVLDDATWTDVQGKLGAVRRVNRQDGTALLDVIVCAGCGAKLYLSQWMAKGRRQGYYRHAGKTACTAKNIPAARLEELIEERIRIGMEGTHIPVAIDHPAEDNAAELAQVDQAIAEIEHLVTSGTMPPASAARMLGTLEAKRETLAALPQHDAWTEVIDGGPFLEKWDELDARGRGALLRKMGIKARARCTGRKVQVSLNQDAPARLTQLCTSE